MTVAPRYAIYLAPEVDTPLWALGSALIGYDAASGREVEFPLPLASNPVRWRALTEEPRRYGFHMTLKAPFRLAEGMTRCQLENELEVFARSRATFDVGRLVLECRLNGEGNGFVCLIPQRHNPDLSALEEAVVRAFDPFRAPLSRSERERRKPQQLSDQQRDYLDRFGYPYVLEEFRPHFSLTGAHSNPGGSADRISMIVANTIGTADFVCRSLFLFEQPSPEQPFVLRRVFSFGR